MKFSAIVAVYNEEQNIAACVKNIRELNEDVEIIFVDGQSRDHSYELCRSLGVQVYHSSKGRGKQLNEGARKASGDILLFLHADTRLPKEAIAQIRDRFKDPDVKAATFRMQFDADHWILKCYAFFTRFDSILTSFGDQGIVVRKDFFEMLGGFPEWPLFEDVHFLRCARRKTKIRSLPGPAITSARKFLEKGIIRQQVCNMSLIFKYILGIPSETLYKEYYYEKPS